MSVNTFLKRYGSMIGEGTFGAITGGALGHLDAKRHGENKEAQNISTVMGAGFGAGGILGVRSIIAAARSAGKMRNFKKTDPRFQKYVEDITNQEDRLSNLTEMLENNSYEAIQDQQYQNVLKAMTSQQLKKPLADVTMGEASFTMKMPKTFERFNQTLETYGKKNRMTRNQIQSVKSEMSKIHKKKGNYNKALNRHKNMWEQDLIAGGMPEKDAKRIARDRYESAREVVLGSPAHDYFMGTEIGDLSSYKPQHLTSFFLVTKKNRQKVFRAFKDLDPRSSIDERLQVLADSTGTPRSAIDAMINPKTHLGRSRILDLIQFHKGFHNHNKDQVRGGFLPFNFQGSNNFSTMRNKLTTYYKTDIEDLAQILDDQTYQGLGHQTARLKEKQKALHARSSTIQNIIERRRKVQGEVKQNMSNLFREPKDLRKSIETNKEQQEAYRSENAKRIRRRVGSTFLGLGG